MYDIMMWAFDAAHNGIPALDDVAFTANRIALGLFFSISGYHKLFNFERHKSIAETMRDDGVPFPKFNEWFVPANEFIGGIAVALGIFAPFFAGVLAIICITATCVDGLKRIKSYEPIDKADWLDDLLYLPEVLYLFMLAVVVIDPGYIV